MLFTRKALFIEEVVTNIKPLHYKTKGFCKTNKSLFKNKQLHPIKNLPDLVFHKATNILFAASLLSVMELFLWVTVNDLSNSSTSNI